MSAARIFKTLLGVLLAWVLLTAAWYKADRPGLLGIACEAGLPNFSKPAGIDKDLIGCTIVGSKQKFTGVLTTGFEASSFSSDDFTPIRDDTGSLNNRAWLTCLGNGCGPALDAELSKNPWASCKKENRLGMATVEVEGWVSESAGGYGHLNQYLRELFVDKVLSVGPPPPKLVQERVEAYRKHGMCDA